MPIAHWNMNIVDCVQSNAGEPPALPSKNLCIHYLDPYFQLQID